MKTARPLEDHWWDRVIPIVFAVLASVVILLAPLYAYRWAQLPFIGAFIEPSMVVSGISDPGWPAARLGVAWPDRLLLANNQPVHTGSEMNAVLAKNGYAPLRLTFARQSGATYQVVFTPRPLTRAEIFDFFGIPYLVGLVFLVTGWWAFRLGWRQRPARAFLMFCATAAIGTASFLDMNTSHRLAAAWVLSLPFTAGALVHLALVFPRNIHLVERHPTIRYLPWAASLIVAAPMLRDVLAPPSIYAYFVSWRWGYLYLAASMLFFLLSQIARMIRSGAPVVRQQSRIIVFGTLLAFGPMLFYLTPSVAGSSPAFQVSIFLPPLAVMPLAIAYAIVRYRLLDVDRVLSRAFSYLLMTGAAVGLFYVLLAFLSSALQERLNASNPLLLAVYLFLLVAAFNPLRHLAQQLIDRAFYRSRADYRTVLTTLSRELVVTPNLDRTLALLERELKKALYPLRMVLYLYDDDQEVYLPHASQPHPTLALSPEDELVQAISRATFPLWLPPGRLVEDLPAEKIQPLLRQLECQVFSGLRYEGRLIGFLALGERRSGDPYNRDDLVFLEAVSGQSTLALENARLFINLQRNLVETLEMKNLMDDVFASIASGVITTDLENKITLFNEAAERILGIPAPQVMGKRLPELQEPLGLALESLATATIAEGAMTLAQEVRPVLPGRGELCLQLSCTPLRDAQQETKGAAIVIDDVTEQRRLEADRERIRQTFGRVVAPRVRDRLLADPSNLHLEGFRQAITVLFADIRGFTPYSEHTEPETLLRVLNSYFSVCAQAVLAEEGTLDKFIGDAVMAFWNAPDGQPDHTLRAVRAALALDRAVQAHRAQLPAEHHLFIGVGIASGVAMVGNVGTDQLFNYTAIGDTVNLAARLVRLAEPGQILLSDGAYAEVAGQVSASRLEAIQVKGRQQIVVPYLLEGIKISTPR